MKKIFFMLIATLMVANTSYADNIFAGYLDTTATGSAAKVNMQTVKKDGYNMVIFAFATVTGSTVTHPAISSDVVGAAKTQGLKTLISLGGENNTFNPGSLDQNGITTLAANLVAMIKSTGADGIDFDLEVKTDPQLLDNIIAAIHANDPTVLISAAPQVVCDAGVTQCTLVTTGNNNDYDIAIKNNRFDYLFIQAYNTPPQNDIHFMVKSYPLIAQQLPSASKTKIIMGQPVAAVASGTTSIYYPTPGQPPLSTKQVTANMLPELKTLLQKPQFGGMMGWSLNIDYDPSAYNDTTGHQPGSFGFYLQACVLNSQCDTQPVMPPAPILNYQLDVSNTDTGTGANAEGIQIAIVGQNHGQSFVTDWLNAPSLVGPGKQPAELVYSALAASEPASNVIVSPSLASVYGQSNLQVFWFGYLGGKTGVCKQDFTFSSNTHIMINPASGVCAINPE